MENQLERPATKQENDQDSKPKSFILSYAAGSSAVKAHLLGSIIFRPFPPTELPVQINPHIGEQEGYFIRPQLIDVPGMIEFSV